MRRIPTWLIFVSLVVASFAPVAALEPGWWVPYYYGALLAGWVSVALLRTEGVAASTVQRVPASRSRRGWSARTEASRLIIVARDQAELYARLRQDRMGDETVRIIPDRRNANRRRQLQVYIPERRLTERRRFDVSRLLVTQGWAQVPPHRS